MKKEKVELGLAYENQIRGIKDTTELLNGKRKKNYIGMIGLQRIFQL